MDRLPSSHHRQMREPRFLNHLRRSRRPNNLDYNPLPMEILCAGRSEKQFGTRDAKDACATNLAIAG
jgi:hypothetical protein